MITFGDNKYYYKGILVIISIVTRELKRKMCKIFANLLAM